MASKSFAYSKGSFFISRRGLIFINLLALIFLGTVSVADAQTQKPDTAINAALNSPDVQITNVTNRGIVGDDTTLVIRVAWNAQARLHTEILGFNAFIEVEYADGSKNSNSQSVDATARQADIRVLNKGANPLRKFTVSLNTQFKFLDSDFINLTEEFELNKTNGFSATKTSTPANRPSSEAFAISRVRAKFGDCAPAKHCFIIDWGTTPRPSLQLNQVNLTASITYNPGSQTRSANASATVSAHTATLTVDDLKTEFANIKLKLTTKVSATITTSQNTQVTGSF
jgi:hypothetical protein